MRESARHGAMAATRANRHPSERNADATVHIGQLDDRVSDSLLWQLLVHAGPVAHVYVPRDRITGKHYGYAFCEYRTARDAGYATRVLNMVKLFGRSIRLTQSGGASAAVGRSLDVGANLFVGNLADDVDEKLLHDAFSAFGSIIDAPYIMREADSTAKSKGYGFVKFADFEASDAAITTMNGQYICNRPITVQYAFKKDGDSQERHGSHAERVLAASAKAAATDNPAYSFRPHTMFADGPPSAMAANAAANQQSGGAAAAMPPPPVPHLSYPQYARPVPPGALPSWQQRAMPPPVMPQAHLGMAAQTQAHPQYQQVAHQYPGNGHTPIMPSAASQQIGWGARRPHATPSTYPQPHYPQAAYPSHQPYAQPYPPNGGYPVMTPAPYQPPVPPPIGGQVARPLPPQSLSSAPPPPPGGTGIAQPVADDAAPPALQ